jgi:hypothetical protein
MNPSFLLLCDLCVLCGEIHDTTKMPTGSLLNAFDKTLFIT